MQEITYPSSDGKTTIHAYIWHAYSEPRAVIQIVHGMEEHALRYSGFAEFLAENGFTAVAADLLGHGRSVINPEALGYFSEKKGYETPYEDIRRLSKIIDKHYPDLPRFMLGHSMGSFFCRKYISEYGDELDGAVICGTGNVSAGNTKAAKAAARIIALFKGWRYRSRFLDNLVFSSYNEKFEKRTRFDWLSKDQTNVDSFIGDRLCGTLFTCNAFYGLFDITAQANKNSTIKKVPGSLPVLVLSGGQDPVGDYGRGVEKFYKRMARRKKRVKIIMYKDCRHEILNDFCAATVRQDVLDFLVGRIKK